MRADSEAEVLRISGHVEPLGVGELLGVVVCRRIQHEDPVTRAQGLTVQFGLLDDGPSEGLHR